MNVGMQRAKGEYIGIVETDDYVDEKMFAELDKTAKLHENADIVKCNFQRFSSEKSSLYRKKVKLPDKKG